jgi:RNA polymerase sigma-70 factor (ECF subfamily)
MTDVLLHEAPTPEMIVRSAARGDEVSFARLVAAHHGDMMRVAFVVCGDEEVTKDAVQSAWTIAWRRMRSLRDPSQIRPWLVTIAANEARQQMRRQRRERVVDISFDVYANGGGDPGDMVDSVDLQRAIKYLRPEDRALIAMRYVADLDSHEIAPHLRMSASGVRSRLARILERLRSDLDIHEEAGR